MTKLETLKEAAPELLAALLYMLQCHREPHDREGEAAYRQAITAINKAKGEP